MVYIIYAVMFSLSFFHITFEVRLFYYYLLFLFSLHICLTSQQTDDFAAHFVADVKKAVEEVQVNPGAKVATVSVMYF